jgi:SAM-dependent methyltransferase
VNDPSQFYTGLVAPLYGPLRSAVPDPEPYARFVSRCGEPGLELGCGGGDPLLDLVGRGLDVEGLDSSADMLEQCRVAALERGLDVVLHHQRMEDMDLGRQYRSIYVAGPTFNLLPDDGTASRALQRIAVHLAPGGRALIPLFVPAPVRDVGVAREHVHDDGTVLRFTALDEQRDEAARVQRTQTRYERIRGDATEVVEREWVLHWYAAGGFVELATEVGLDAREVGDGRDDRRPGDAVYVLTARGGSA